MMRLIKLAVVSALVVSCGCATSYSWRPTVPNGLRTVAVPTFTNESEVMELGAIMTRQMLRELQREGTFKIRRTGDSAIEVQGKVLKAGANASAYDRRSGMRISAYDYTAEVLISVIDKNNGRVLVDNRVFIGRTSFTAGQDISNAERDAAGRLADDVARQVVDMMVNLNYEEKAVTK